MHAARKTRRKGLDRVDSTGASGRCTRQTCRRQHTARCKTDARV
ncbi:hypothetical protein ACS15_0380 [Ralstonia insidiosa]|uniref:Uncharacterized protein n=1 Tax=Ralstonia insidiosa TaxID=190721 RepID=A0AAC9FPY3_9RALS|nr:hypothetical protein ACS15_0380 [Ralstonia insidiosa]